MIISDYHEFDRGVHDHRPGRRPAVPKHSGSAGARPRCGRGRCRRTPGRQGREHPPGLQLRLAAVPDVGEAGGHPALPAAPQAVALYLGHLASTGRSIATVQQARSAISHFHAAAS